MQGQDQPQILQTFFKAAARLIEVQDQVVKRIVAGRARLADDVEACAKIFQAAHRELERKPYFAPEKICKDMASHAYIMQRVMRAATDEVEAEDYHKIFIQTMSSRRVIFEFESWEDKEELIALILDAAENYQAFTDFLRQAK